MSVDSVDDVGHGSTQRPGDVMRNYQAVDRSICSTGWRSFGLAFCVGGVAGP